MSESRGSIGIGNLTPDLLASFDVGDHAGPEGLVRQRVDDDEAAGHAVLSVGIEVERVMRLDRNLTDLIEFEPSCTNAIEGVDVDSEIDGAHNAAYLMRC